jgi:polysaccharide biosynthesis transport protein
MTTAVDTFDDQLHVSHGGAAEGGGAPSVGDIFSMLRRRLVMIVVSALFFNMIWVGSFAVWWIYYPGYLSEALIELISNIPATDLSLEQQRLQQDEHERFVRTQAVLMKSPSILGEALKVNTVRETGWFARVRAKGWEPLLELDRDLSSAPVRGTNFLRVAIECRGKKDPHVIVNEVVNQWYHAVKQRTAEDYASGSLEAARNELDDLRRDISSKRERLKAIAQRMPPGALRNPDNITALDVAKYGDQVATLRLELSQLDQYRSIYNDPSGVPITAEDRAVVEQDPQVAELARAGFLLRQQRAADAKVFGETHSVLRQLDAQIAATDQKIEELRFEKWAERRSDIREAANTAYANTQHSLFLSEENLRRAEAQQQDQDRLLFDYGDLSRDIGRTESYKLTLEEYIRGLARVKSQQTAINVNIAQSAIEPLQRHSPNVYLLPVGIIFAFAMAVGLGLGVELLDKSIRTGQDIVRHMDIGILGAIPDTDDEEVSISHVETAVRDEPQSMIAEAFRQIRTNLQFSSPADRQRTIMLTSPRPEDGTTSVACNLALTLAQGGRRVLLVDANLRRPRIDEIFSQTGESGLSNILIGEGSLASCVAKTDNVLLDTLGSGPKPPNPVDLFTGSHWPTFLKEAAGQYDQVIFDTPPVLLASDAAVIASSVDGAVLVIRANRNSRGVARRAYGVLRTIDTHVFGAVLNAARVTRGGYFREQLRTFYEYQEGAELPTLPAK